MGSVHMSEYSLKYGNSFFRVNLNDSFLIADVRANAVKIEALSPGDAVRQAIRTPVQSAPLDEKIKAGEKVCLIVPDITRVWESPQVYIPVMLDELRKCGIADDDITILCAAGTHRPMTMAEHLRLMGEDAFNRHRVVDHNCRDEKSLVDMGVTSNGTRVRLNRLAVEADKVVICGGIVYHFMAGFGGGPKAILPGIAALETIQHNHKMAFGPNGESNPDVRAGNISKSNILHDDIVEACAMINPVFSLNVVVDDRFRIIKAFAGDWRKAHREACSLVQAMDGVAIPKKAPLVIASAGGSPKDINLFQSVKLLNNALAAASPGGVVMLLAACPEKFGNAECERQVREFQSVAEREKDLLKNFTIGGYAGFLLAQAAERYKLVLISEIDPQCFVNTAVHAFSSFDKGLDCVKELCGGSLDTETILMCHGATTLPIVNGTA